MEITSLHYQSRIRQICSLFLLPSLFKNLLGQCIWQIHVGGGAEVGGKLCAQDRHSSVSADKNSSERDLVSVMGTSSEPTDATFHLHLVLGDWLAEWSVT